MEEKKIYSTLNAINGPNHFQIQTYFNWTDYKKHHRIVCKHNFGVDITEELENYNLERDSWWEAFIQLHELRVSLTPTI